MKFIGNLQVTGHPIIKFGEKYKNIKIRDHFIGLLLFPISIKKLDQNSRKNSDILTANLQKTLFHFYFFKIESRKKKYELNRKIKEFILSDKTIKLCVNYEKLKPIGLFKSKKPYSIFLDFDRKIYQPIQDISGGKIFFCFQAGETGVFSIEAPNKIFLDSIKERKTTHVLNSKLLKLNLFSPNPDFPYSFVVSSKNCSEFWEFSNFHQRISINYLYHKDLIAYQKYRQNTKLIDFGTFNKKWKCFDKIVQKYTFSHQFNEYIRSITTNFNDSLTAISTLNYLVIFDNRIGKKVSTLKMDWKSYYSIEWSRNDSNLILLGKKTDVWDYMRSTISVKNKPETKNYEKIEFKRNLNLLFLKKKNKIKIINNNNKNFNQWINSKKNIESIKLSKSGSLLGLSNNYNITIFQLR